MEYSELFRMVMRIIMAIAAFIGFSESGISQISDTLLKSNSSSFSSFQNSINREFDKFREQNDSLFVEFLTRNWKEYQLLQDSIVPRINPKTQPRVDGFKNPTKEVYDSSNRMNEIDKKELQYDSMPEKNSIYKNTGRSSFEFYGEIHELPVITEAGDLPSVNNEYLKSFFNKYRSDPKQLLISRKLDSIAKDLKLNDFGYLLFTLKASQAVYYEINKRILFTWFTLIGNGLDVKAGYMKDKVYLLISCDWPIRNQGHVTISGVKYYLYMLSEQETPGKLNISSDPLPGKHFPLKVGFRQFPLFQYESVNRKYHLGENTISLDLNQFQIDYLNQFMVTDLKFYFEAPFSEYAIKSLDRDIPPLLKGKTEVEKVNILLHLIQNSFLYKDDMGQFGREKYMFADEALYYPYIDCDDRAVLMAKMVKRYTALDAVGLDYPDHVSVGVKFTVPLNGDSVIYNKGKYYICDPTYIGATAGMAMRTMKTKSPVVIPLEK